MIPKTVSKLLDLHLNLHVKESEEENCAVVMASSPMKMSVRLEGIRETYPNASIIAIDEEWGMGLYTVCLGE